MDTGSLLAHTEFWGRALCRALCLHHLTAWSQGPLLEGTQLSSLLYRQGDLPIPSRTLLKILFTLFRWCLAFSVLHAQTKRTEATSWVCLIAGDLRKGSSVLAMSRALRVSVQCRRRETLLGACFYSQGELPPWPWPSLI